MPTVSIDKLSADVATILGEPLARDCRPEESSFPDIADAVRILTPGILAALSSHPADLRPYPEFTDGNITIRPSVYMPLVYELAKKIKAMEK